MLIKDGIEYYYEYELADLMQVRSREIYNWYWDGVLEPPVRFPNDSPDCLRWTREQVEIMIGHKIPEYAIEEFEWSVIRE